MTRYTVRILEPALAALERLQAKDRRRLWRRIRALADEPRPQGAIAIRARQGMLRIRVGNYWVVYAVQDRVLLVLVVRVARRSRAYSDLPDASAGGSVDLPGTVNA